MPGFEGGRLLLFAAEVEEVKMRKTCYSRTHRIDPAAHVGYRLTARAMARFLFLRSNEFSDRCMIFGSMRNER